MNVYYAIRAAINRAVIICNAEKNQMLHGDYEKDLSPAIIASVYISRCFSHYKDTGNFVNYQLYMCNIS